MSETLVKVENVSKKFCRDLKRSLWYGMKDLGSELFCRLHNSKGQLRKDEFWSVKDVSFELKRGECIGLIGRNGAGKTTLLKMLNGLIKPDTGRIEMRGRVGALIALGAGFNPILTGRENIYVNASVMGLNKRKIDAKIDEIIDFAELDEFIDTPVQSYSSGMQVRLGFAVATAIKPDILLLDEVLAVGDANFRAKCFRRIGQILEYTAVVFVSHNMAQIQRICNQVSYMQKGRITFLGSSSSGIIKYIENSIRVLEPFILKDPEIINCRIDAAKSAIKYGEDQEIRVSVQCECPQNIGLALFSLADQTGELCVQGDFSGQLDFLPAGISEFVIKMPALCLSGGIYYVNLSIHSQSCKRTVIHLRNGTSFQVIACVGYGVRYQVDPKIILNRQLST